MNTKEIVEQTGVTMDNVYACYERDIERFVKLVRADEREACAALVEADGRVHEKAPDARWAKVIGRLIRARGNHEPT